MLAVRQKGRTGEQKGIPQRDFAAAKAGEHKAFPGVVLDDEVADEGIMGDGSVERRR